MVGVLAQMTNYTIHCVLTGQLIKPAMRDGYQVDAYIGLIARFASPMRLFQDRQAVARMLDQSRTQYGSTIQLLGTNGTR